MEEKQLNHQVFYKSKSKNIFVMLATLFVLLAMCLTTGCDRKSEPKYFNVTLPILDIPGWYVMEPTGETTNLKKGSEFKFSVTYTSVTYAYVTIGLVKVKANNDVLTPSPVDPNDEENTTVTYTATINDNVAITFEGLPNYLHTIMSIPQHLTVKQNGQIVNVNDNLNHGTVIELIYDREGYHKPTFSISGVQLIDETMNGTSYVYRYLVIGTLPLYMYGDIYISEFVEKPMEFTLGDIPKDVVVKDNQGTTLVAGATIHYDDVLEIAPVEKNKDSYEQTITVTGAKKLSEYTYSVTGNIAITYEIKDVPSLGKLRFTPQDDYYIVEANSYDITGRVVIPAEYQGKSVKIKDNKSYENNGFVYCSKITELVFMEGITYIGSGSFSSCTSLRSITLPSTITAIGDNAFSYCCDLVQIVNKSPLKLELGSTTQGEIARYASIIVDDESKMGEFNVVYDGLKYYENISENLRVVVGVEEQRSLYNVKANTVAIAGHAFSGFDQEQNYQSFSVYLPNSCKTIGCYAFANSNIDYIQINNGVTEIGERAFFECQSLTSINLPNTLTILGYSAFSWCYNLVSVQLSNTKITALENETFAYCSKLQEIELPEGVTRIGTEKGIMAERAAFENCTALRSVVLPSTLISISSFERQVTFSGCNSLFEVVNKSQLPLQIGHSDYGSVALNAYVITTEKGKFQTYGEINYYENAHDHIMIALGFEDARHIKDKNVVLEANTTEVLPKAFVDPDGATINISSVVLPEGLTRIGEQAFKNCYVLRSVTLPSTLNFIGDNAFAGCSILVEVVNRSALPLEEGSELYGQVALNAWAISSTKGTFYTENEIYYYENTSLNMVIALGAEDISYRNPIQNVALKDTTTAVYKEAFYFSDATNITMSDNVTRIGKSAFSICYDLTSLKLSNNIEIIEDETFYNCYQLTELKLPDNLKHIGNGAFEKCSGLTELNLPDGLESIGDKAFKDCTGITELVLPDGLLTIGENAFAGIKLTTIKFPESVTCVGLNAFSSSTFNEIWIYGKALMEFFENNPETCKNFLSYLIKDGRVIIPLESDDDEYSNIPPAFLQKQNSGLTFFRDSPEPEGYSAWKWIKL